MVARVAVAAGVAVAAAAVGSAGAAPRADHAAQAWNVLPPGQAGGIAFTKTSTDQAKLYDGLTPLRDRVTDTDLRRFFKRETLGLGIEKAVSSERPRRGVLVQRDRFGVPHVTGARDVDVAFGAGWATAQDRQLLIELLRGPGRIAALDVPGLDAFAAALSGATFLPSAETEAFLTRQYDLLARSGPKGERTVRLIDAYVAGINAAYRKAGLALAPWTRADVVAVAGLIGGIFGAGGGDETARVDFLARLQERLGGERGRQVWEDLRLRDDPEARTGAEARFVHGTERGTELGNVVVDAASFEGEGPSALTRSDTPRLAMSNALLVGARRSATGHPLLVAGPQVGYFYPGILMELDLRGGGFDARGAAFPGISFAVLLGRGQDYAWSATSAGADLIDEYAETLCEGSDTMYLFKGECRAMTTFDAGVLRGAPGTPDRRVTFRETVHGPVIGYATVEGRRVAIAQRRSTRGRELLTAPFFVDLSTNAVRSAKDFLAAAATMELTFNWHYADDRDIAMFTSGRLPVRPSTVDAGLLTKGTGEYEWTGFLPAARHPQAVNPRSGVILNWNNKPAHGFAASDAEWSWGAVQRVDLLWGAVQRRRVHTLASLVGAMNLAATQDLRVVRVWPSIRAVLDRGSPPSQRASTAARLVDEWLAAGGSRLDLNGDGAVDWGGAAVLDAAWKSLGRAVLEPVLGPLVSSLETLVPPDDAASPGGSAYLSGWYTYVQKDLRALLGRPVQGQLGTRFCGAGTVSACAASLWAALDAAVATLGPDPTTWRADATRERIRFTPGILPATMRWTNRPTFQQVVSFASHRPR